MTFSRTPPTRLERARRSHLRRGRAGVRGRRRANRPRLTRGRGPRVTRLRAGQSPRVPALSSGLVRDATTVGRRLRDERVPPDRSRAAAFRPGADVPARTDAPRRGVHVRRRLHVGDRALLRGRMGMRRARRRPPRRGRPEGVPGGGGGCARRQGRDGVLRAFSNTCRHRGHELLAPGETEPARDQVPVPRVGVRPRRSPAGRSALRRDAGVRQA